MTDMVERVARAIGTRAIGADVWDRMASPQRAMFRAQARAAIEAMRSPTDEMAQAGMYAASWYSHTKLVGEEQADPTEQLNAVFAAMIDTALGEVK